MVSTSSARNNRPQRRLAHWSRRVERAAAPVLARVALRATCGEEKEPTEASATASSASAAAPAEAAPAGHVVAIAGKVQARRATTGAEDRTLALQSEVFADDTVHTAAEASVTIALEHNLARWTLGPNQSRRVDKGLAWKAPRQAATTVLAHKVVAEETTAAGRHCEREAAGTTESALREAEPTPEPEPVKLHAAPPPMRAPKEEPIRVAKPSKPRAKPQPGAQAPGSGRPSRGNSRSDARPDRPADRAGSGSLDALVGAGGMEMGRTGGGRGLPGGEGGGGLRERSSSVRVVVDATARAGGGAKLDASLLKRIAARLRTGARHCGERVAVRQGKVRGTVVVRVLLSASPSVKVVRNDTGSSQLAACLSAQSRRFRVPPQPNGAWFELSFTFKSP